MNQNSYTVNRQWSDKFIPQLQMICGMLMFRVSSVADDTMRNTDLIVLTTDSQKRIACRVRRYSYFERYPHDVTIRTVNKNHKTEFQKIIEGWGDLMIYAFSSKDESSIMVYYVIDLNSLRYNISRMKFVRHCNRDGTEFVSCDVRYLPQGVLYIKAGIN